MNTFFLKLKVLFLLLIAASWGHPAPTFSADFGSKQATAIKNHDGDTITVSIPDWPSVIGDKIEVRVLGVDTPEILGKCADEKLKAGIAKEFTANFIKDKQVLLKNIQRDKYFRILANVYVGESSLSSELLKNGLARPYFGDTKSSWCIN
jgi:micrococcal nuclease